MNLLLPFHHDGTLIFASRFGDTLKSRGHKVTYLFIQKGYDLQKRQLEMYLENASFLTCSDRELGENDFITGKFSGFDAIIMCTPTRAIKRMLDSSSFKRNPHRPCFVCFHPGLELFFDYGLSIRKNFDILFVTPQSRIDELNDRQTPLSKHWQHIGFGHPYFVTDNVSESRTAIGKHSPSLQSKKRDIFFLSQSVSPEARSSRYHIAKLLIALAQRWSDHTIHIKPRYLLGEQKSTPHEELYSYIDILREIASVEGEDTPKNLVVTDCHIDEVMQKAAGVIACTSTALMDAISADVPAMAYVDYVDFWKDPLNASFRRIFYESNILTSLPDLMNLEFGEPASSWKAQYFRAKQLLLDEFEEACLRYSKRMQ